MPDQMARALSEVDVSDHLANEHREFVGSYRRADLAAAKQITIDHNETRPKRLSGPASSAPLGQL